MMLKEIIDNAEYAVFFGGAGVSTESGIPDFRGKNGIYTDGREEDPEYCLSHTCLLNEPEKFYDFYRRRILLTGIEPNRAHYALAELEKQGKIKAVITQNIDGLHTAAGSRNVYELHGSSSRFYCMKCGEEYTEDYVRKCGELVPYCPICGGIIRPHVVLYEEWLDEDVLRGAVDETLRADVLIAAGSSLVVNPAASLVRQFRGKHLVIINYDPTPCDRYADLIIRESVGKVLEELVKQK